MRLPAVVAQMCTDGYGLADYLHSFRFVDASVCAYADVVGFPLLATIVYGAVAIPTYLTTGSIMIPVILLLLTGGATVAQLAAPGTALAAIALLVAGAGVLTVLYYSFSR